MSTYLISYDLGKPGRDYELLYDAIKGVSGVHWHVMQSLWIVVTSKSATDIRDALKSNMDANDKLLVVKSGGMGAWSGLSSKGTEWLKKNL